MDTIVPNASSEAIALLVDMLKWNPFKRPTVAQSLKFKYFANNLKLGSGSSNSNIMRSTNRTSSLYGYSNLWESDRHRYLADANLMIKNQNVNSSSLEKQIYNSPSQSSFQNSANRLNSNISIKEQYLSRSRYIAGQSTKNSIFRNSGNSSFLKSF